MTSENPHDRTHAERCPAPAGRQPVLTPSGAPPQGTAGASTPPAPLDAKALAIGVLAVTACVLFVGYVLLLATPRTAYAIGTSDRGGDYVMVTQQLSNSQEGVVILDAAAQRMSVYGYDFNQKVLRAIDLNIPLDRLPGAPAAGGDPAKP